MTVVFSDPNKNWLSNEIQFPRLIAEIEAAGIFTPENIELLSESMDLSQSQIIEIVDRAQSQWDAIKQATAVST